MSKGTQNCTGQYQISFSNNKKVPITSSLFHEIEFALEIKKKPEIHFSRNNAPYKVTTVNYLRLHYFTEKLLSTIKFLSNIFDIIQLLDPNKAHSHDMIIIWILKICGKSICRLFELIFNECISKKKYLTIEINQG